MTVKKLFKHFIKLFRITLLFLCFFSFYGFFFCFGCSWRNLFFLFSESDEEENPDEDMYEDGDEKEGEEEGDEEGDQRMGSSGIRGDGLDGQVGYISDLNTINCFSEQFVFTLLRVFLEKRRALHSW